MKAVTRLLSGSDILATDRLALRKWPNMCRISEVCTSSCDPTEVEPSQAARLNNCGMNIRNSISMKWSTILLVTVKPKFQITIPAKLRKGIDLHGGDLMEANLIAEGIVIRPMVVVNRNRVADRIAATFAATVPSSEDVGRSEELFTEYAIAEVAASRRGRLEPEE